MMKVIAAILLALVAIGGIIALIGSRLPVNHVATRSVTIAAPADQVFGTITDFAGSPTWRTELKAVAVHTDAASGRTRVTEKSSTGDLTMEVEEQVPPTRLVMRIVGDGLPYGGAWAYAVETLGNMTRVTITEHGEVYNPVFRFISSYLMGHTGSLETYLANLGRKYGADVLPVDAPPVPLRP